MSNVMTEPDDHTAWIDRTGDTWVRVDEVAAPDKPWRCLCDGPGWGNPGHPGGARDWESVADYGPFTEADPERTARAVDQILRLEGVR